MKCTISSKINITPKSVAPWQCICTLSSSDREKLSKPLPSIESMLQSAVLDGLIMPMPIAMVCRMHKHFRKLPLIPISIRYWQASNVCKRTFLGCITKQSSLSVGEIVPQNLNLPIMKDIDI